MSSLPTKRPNVVIVRQTQHLQNVILCEEEYVIEGEQMASSSGDDVPCHAMDPFYYPADNIVGVSLDHSTCHICGEDLRNKRYYNHLFDFHGYTKQQLDVLKSQKRLEVVRRRAEERGNSQKKRKYEVSTCESCGMQFASKPGLNSHRLKTHGITEQDNTKRLVADNIVCPSYGCEMNFTTYMDLAIHVDSNHRNLVTVSEAFRIRRIICADKHSFAKWKRDMEKLTRSEFFMRTSQKVTFANKTVLFKCLYSNSRGQPKGRRCEQCPAFIRCCERTSGKYEVVACFGHLGHEHPTETQEAKELRELKWSEIEEKGNQEEVDDGDNVGEIDSEDLPQHEITSEEVVTEDVDHEEDVEHIMVVVDEHIPAKRARMSDEQHINLYIPQHQDHQY